MKLAGSRQAAGNPYVQGSNKFSKKQLLCGELALLPNQENERTGLCSGVTWEYDEVRGKAMHQQSSWPQSVAARANMTSKHGFPAMCTCAQWEA